MHYHVINLAQAPEVKRLILAADPTYRKRTAALTVASEVALRGTYWSGGTRATYTAVNIATRQSQTAEQYAPPQFGGPKEVPTVALPPGAVIVQTGFFCGKVSTAQVFIHPQDLNPALTGPL